jgi:hypothetical protein
MEDRRETFYLRYPALHHGQTPPETYQGICAVRARLVSDRAVIIVSALDGALAEALKLRNRSTSITNRIEWIAPVLRQKYGTLAGSLIYIEHYPARGMRTGQGWETPAKYEGVSFLWVEPSGGPDEPPDASLVAIDPDWRRLPIETVAELYGSEISDAVLVADLAEQQRPSLPGDD